MRRRSKLCSCLVWCASELRRQSSSYLRRLRVDSQGRTGAAGEGEGEVGSGGEFSALVREITKEGRLPVVDAEAAKELAVGGEAAPSLGDDGRT